MQNKKTQNRRGAELQLGTSNVGLDLLVRFVRAAFVVAMVDAIMWVCKVDTPNIGSPIVNKTSPGRPRL